MSVYRLTFFTACSSEIVYLSRPGFSGQNRVFSNLPWKAIYILAFILLLQ